MEWERLTDEQLREAQAEKAQALHNLFASKTEMDFSDDELSEIRALNKALNDITKVIEERAEANKGKSDLEAIKASAQGVLSGSAVTAVGTEIIHAGAKASGSGNEFKTLGQMFMESQAYKGYDRMQKRGPTSEVDVKDIMLSLKMSEMAAKTLLDTTDWPSMERRLPGLTVEYPRRRPMIADLIPQAGTDSKTISYVIELVGVNNADFVAEGAAKPESELGFEAATTVVEKIATWIPVTDELMEDEPALRGIIVEGVNQSLRGRPFLADSISQ